MAFCQFLKKQDTTSLSSTLRGLLFKHETSPVAFSLVVHDFGVSHAGGKAGHLPKPLQDATHTIAVAKMGKESFCGVTLQWNNEKRMVDLPIPGHVEKALQQFCHADFMQPDF